MKIRNKLDKPFGPAGSWTGIVMFIAGAVMTYYSLVSLALAIVGAFVGFTFEGTIIDTDERRVKNVNYLFGFIPVGKWIAINSEMKLGLKRIHRGYSTMTRGNSLNLHIVDVRILLYDANNRQIVPLKKTISVEEARKDIEELSTQLGLSIINI